MSDIPNSLRRLVVHRAGNRCEYCGLAQQGQEALFHVDHVLPRVAGGTTLPENLALACASCSLRKGARSSATDPETGHQTVLFNPRRDLWHEHFRWDGLRLVGLTACGRATVEALKMNRPLVLAIRDEELARGRHPPPPPPPRSIS